MLRYHLSAGYDVWMPNVRGNKYSKNHVTYDSCPTCKEYWSFGLEEPATIDYPASIDYILNVTQQKDLYFIGYSMGTSHYFMLLSEKPQYNEKIKAGIMIGPAIYLDNPIFKHFRHILTTILNVIEWLGQYEAASSALAELSHRTCTNQFFSPLCHRMWNKLLNANDDLKTSLVKMSNTPAGSAILQLKFLAVTKKILSIFVFKKIVTIHLAIFHRFFNKNLQTLHAANEW